MANKPVLNIAEAYAKIKASKFNENFDILLDYIEEVSEELTLKVDTINSQLSSSVLSNLQSVYPIGSLYIGITDTCPIANLFGNWEKVAEGLCLQGTKGSQVAGETIEAGLPDHRHDIGLDNYNGSKYGTRDTSTSSKMAGYGEAMTNKKSGYTSYASEENSIYGKSETVQPPAYLVNVWKRTA
jgi:hypothetical protein